VNRILSVVRAVPVQVRFGCSILWRWLFRRKQYPLLILSPAQNGFLTTVRLLWRLKLTKVVAVGKTYHFSLVEPRWPSDAYDQLIANGGLNLAAAGTSRKKQIDLAILAVTRRCPYRCSHCYELQNLADDDTIPIERWIEVIAELQQIGVSVIVLSGGEPLMRFEQLLSILNSVDKRRSDFHLHTTGHTLDATKAQALKDAGLVAAGIGLDDFDRIRQAELRKSDRVFDSAVNAIRLFSEAGLFTYVNMCLTRPMMNLQNLTTFYKFIAKQGANALQLLEPIPCGAYARAAKETFCSEADRSEVMSFFLGTYRRRWKRSPAVYYNAYLESPRHLGCMMGGLSHLQIDGQGNVKPCAFLPVSFGNVFESGFRPIYDKMRVAIPHPLHTVCPAMQMAGLIETRSVRGFTIPVPYDEIAAEWHSKLGYERQST
jgi:MoaA/NifB/PqqE/SkfB family radical SAM enzyme